MPISLKIIITALLVAALSSILGLMTVESEFGQVVAKSGLVLSLLVAVSAALYQIWTS